MRAAAHAITDVWLHFTGADIDHVTVLVRATRDMNLISGGRSAAAGPAASERALWDSKVDPSAVMCLRRTEDSGESVSGARWTGVRGGMRVRGCAARVSSSGDSRASRCRAFVGLGGAEVVVVEVGVGGTDRR